MNKLSKLIFHLSILLILLFVSCVTQRTSTIVGFDYNDKNNLSNYIVFPYGSVSFPGKWEKTSYNNSSKQQFFINDDSISIAIAFVPCNKFEFNADNSKKGFEFTKAYYEWDSQYFVNQYGLKRTEIETDSTNNFIIWKICGQINSQIIDNYFLIGEKNCIVKNYSILKTDLWSEEKKVSFLKSLYFEQEKK